MAVVADYMDGNCRIIIKDDYAVKTDEEVQQILRNMAEIYVKYRLREMEEGAR